MRQVIQLNKYNQFVIVKNEELLNPFTLQPSHVNNRYVRLDRNTAKEILKQNDKSGLSLGFMLTKNDPFYFLNMYNCIQPDGLFSEKTVEIYVKLNGGIIQRSNRGANMQIIGSCVFPKSKYKYKPKHNHEYKNPKLGLELYTSDRIITLRTENIESCDIHDDSNNLPYIIVNYFN